jgi:hypothetical protein
MVRGGVESNPQRRRDLRGVKGAFENSFYMVTEEATIWISSEFVERFRFFFKKQEVAEGNRVLLKLSRSTPLMRQGMGL